MAHSSQAAFALDRLAAQRRERRAVALVTIESVTSLPRRRLSRWRQAAATQMAPLVQPLFRRVQRTRDIVLVDQRGTGRSNPLNCRAGGDSLRDLTESDDRALDHLKTCLSGLPGDVRLYTTTIAMDDLD